MPPTPNFFEQQRLRTGRNRTQIAAACGVTEACIRNWETGHSAPSARQTQTLADAYRVSFPRMAVEIARLAVAVAARPAPAAA